MPTEPTPPARDYTFAARYAQEGFLGKEAPVDIPSLVTYPPTDDFKTPPAKRTQAEQELLDEIAMTMRARGKTYRQIAAILAISTSAAHGRVKRHLHRQRVKLQEHAADQRDYDLQILAEMEPIHRKKAREGDPRSYYLVQRGIELRHKLLRTIPNPTNEELLRRQSDLTAALTEFDEEVIEAGDSERPLWRVGADGRMEAVPPKGEPWAGRTCTPYVAVSQPVEFAAAPPQQAATSEEEVTPGRRDLLGVADASGGLAELSPPADLRNSAAQPENRDGTVGVQGLDNGGTNGDVQAERKLQGVEIKTVASVQEDFCRPEAVSGSKVGLSARRDRTGPGGGAPALSEAQSQKVGPEEKVTPGRRDLLKEGDWPVDDERRRDCLTCDRTQTALAEPVTHGKEGARAT